MARPSARRSGLEDVEEGEAHRLLDLGVAVDLDVGAVPEVVQIGPLLLDQAVPARLAGTGQRGGNLVPQCRPRTLRRPAVGDELDQAQPLARLEGGGDRHAPEVGEALGRDVRRRRGPITVVHGHGDPQAAPGRGVQESRGGTGRIRGTPSAAALRARPTTRGSPPAAGTHLVRHQLGLDHHPHRRVERLDLVGDGGHRALDQRHQAGRAHPDAAAARRHPLDPALQQCRRGSPGPLVAIGARRSGRRRARRRPAAGSACRW